MELTVTIPTYNPEKGFEYKWENNFEITIKIEHKIAVLSANKEGLISLANHFLNLAQDKIPLGYHLHFDEYNSLENNSMELIVQKQ